MSGNSFQRLPPMREIADPPPLSDKFARQSIAYRDVLVRIRESCDRAQCFRPPRDGLVAYPASEALCPRCQLVVEALGRDPVERSEPRRA